MFGRPCAHVAWWLPIAAALLVRHARDGRFDSDRIRVTIGDDVTFIVARENAQAEAATTIATE